MRRSSYSTFDIYIQFVEGVETSIGGMMRRVGKRKGLTSIDRDFLKNAEGGEGKSTLAKH